MLKQPLVPTSSLFLSEEDYFNPCRSDILLNGQSCKHLISFQRGNNQRMHLYLAADNHTLLQILCALVSSDDSKQRWLQSSGIVKLLQRLTLDVQTDIKVYSMIFADNCC